MSITSGQEHTVEEIRKLALPLSTHILSGEGLLERPISWTTVIHPEDDIASKSVQKRELILIAPLSNPPKATAIPNSSMGCQERRLGDHFLRPSEPHSIGRGEITQPARAHLGE